MNSYSVFVRTEAGQVSYSAIGTDSVAVHMAAIDQFGPCAITVKPAQVAP